MQLCIYVLMCLDVLDGGGGGVGGKVLGRSEQILGEELLALAKEVARVEAV